MRAFIAVDMPAEMREALAGLGAELKKQTSNIVPVKSGVIHITLQFLGEISDSGVAKAEAAMQAVELPRFMISVEGVGTFGRRTVYAGIGEGAEELKELYSMLSGRLDAMGVPFLGYGYTPHITLGRVKGRIDRKKLFSIIKPSLHREFGSFVAEGFVLKKSTLTSEGPVYEELYKAELF